MIKFLAMFNIVGSRDNSLGPGVYVQNKKIASIGFHVHKGVITHGVSINLKNNLKTFEHIAVCGHTDLVMTSVEKELRSLDGGSVKKLDLEKLGGELAHTCLDLL